jgi:molecular chaperone GrpE
MSDASNQATAQPGTEASGRFKVEAGATTSADPAGSAAALSVELAEAQEQARVQRDLYLRAAAELDNVRKRAQRDIENAHRYALERFAGELLAVRDSLALGVASGANADAATLLAGQQATLKLLDRAFEKFSITPIDPAGQRFDPSLHEAVLIQESAAAAPDTVLTVVQSGYELNGRLLRPARVVVAKAPSGAAPS